MEWTKEIVDALLSALERRIKENPEWFKEIVLAPVGIEHNEIDQNIMNRSFTI